MRLFMMANVIAATILSAVSANATPLWQLVLVKQVRSERQCRTHYISNILERQVGSEIHLSARVRCDDGQIFDADWNLQKRRFMLRPNTSTSTATLPTEHPRIELIEAAEDER